MKNPVLQILLCVLFLTLRIPHLIAQPAPPPAVYTDGPIELKVRVREINTLVNSTDSSAGLFAPDEFTYKIWIKDSTDLDGLGWLGGSCLTTNFNSPGVSLDFNTLLFSHIYATDTVPQFFDVRLDAWEDDSDDAACGGDRCNFESNYCCGVVVFGACVGFTQEDDDRCIGNPFATGVDYRRGSPGQWFDHGYISGSCGNTYLPRIESYWRYVNGTSCNDAIDLDTLASCSLSHFNSNESYANNFSASPGNDVFYKFSVTSQTSATISLCNTASFDSYLYLLDSNCNVIASNDDACNLQSSIGRTLNAGTYFVVVDGKTSSEIGGFTLFIKKVNGLTAYITPINPGCFGFNDGSAQAIVSGGMTNPFGTGYTFRWNDIALQTSQTATDLVAGFYQVTVTDLGGCTVTASTLLTSPAEIILTVSATNDTCGGMGEGSATANVQGALVNYLWSNGAFDSVIIHNLQSGIYKVTVVDHQGCVDSGQVSITEKAFLSGTIRSETGAAIQNVIVKGTSQGTVKPDTTGVDGNYNLELDTGSYCYAIPSRNDVVTNNGITALDIVLIRRHVLGTPLISPYQIIAADVNASNSVTTTDILLIRSVILGTNSSFPGGRHWTFVPDDFVFADTLNPFPYDTSRYLATVCRDAHQDFIGMKLGDVNNSWDPNILKSESFVGKVYLKMDCIQSVQAGEEIIIPVRVKRFENVSGIQFTLSWDKDALLFQTIENGKLHADFAMQKVGEGLLGVLWTDENAESKSLKDDEILFSLKFIANRAGEECEVIISSEMISIEAVNGNLELLELNEWKDEYSLLGEESSDGYRLYQNYPNPFSESTVLSFELPEEEMVTIEVFDLVGKKIYEQVGMHEPGRNNIEFNGAQFSAGIHYVSVRTNNFNKSITIVCQTD